MFSIGILGSLLIGVMILFIISKSKYNKELSEITKKEYSLKPFLPIGLFLIDIPLIGRLLKRTNHNILQLYGKQEYSYRVRLYEAERYTIMALIFFASVLFVFILSIKNIGINNITEIQRPKFGEGEKSYRYYYDLEGMGDKSLEAVTIIVPENKPTEEEIDLALEKLLKELPAIILRDNKSLDFVDKPLYLPQKINEGINIIWKSENEKLLLNSGDLRYNNIFKEGEEVILKAYINCYGREIEKKYKLNLYKKALNRQEKKLLIKSDIKNTLSKSELQKLEEDVIKLPLRLNDSSLSWYDGEQRADYKLYLLLGLGLGMFFYFCKGYELKIKIKERQEKILRAFPGCINKFVLLMNAGMSFGRAWEKITQDYCMIKKRGGKKILLYEEMILTLEDIQKGVSEIKAYEAFGQRCKIPEILRFTAIIIQNIKKGSHLLIRAMEQQSKEAMTMREDLARKKGEKASTKLILPMGIMFLAILIIVITPALITLRLN